MILSLAFCRQPRTESVAGERPAIGMREQGVELCDLTGQRFDSVRPGLPVAVHVVTSGECADGVLGLIEPGAMSRDEQNPCNALDVLHYVESLTSGVRGMVVH